VLVFGSTRELEQQQEWLDRQRRLPSRFLANAGADRCIVDAKRDESLRHDRQPVVTGDAYPVLVVGKRADVAPELAVAREAIAMDQAAARGPDEVDTPVVQ